jgi:hypothetical protein
LTTYVKGRRKIKTGQTLEKHGLWAKRKRTRIENTVKMTTSSSTNTVVSSSAVAICAAYCILSTACVLHNKHVVSYVYPFESCLLLVQNVVCILYILLMGSSWLIPNVVHFLDPLLKQTPSQTPHHPYSEKHVSDSDLESLASSPHAHSASSGALQHHPQGIRWTAGKSLARVVQHLAAPYSLDSSKADWLIGICYSLSVLTATWSLAYLSVPMSQSIKRCTVIVTWVMELYWSPTETTWRCVPSLITLLTGISIMSYHDLQFHAAGYLFGVLACVLQGASLELGKRMLTQQGKEVWSVLLINCIVSTVVQIGYLVASGDIVEFWRLVTLQPYAEGTLWRFQREGKVVWEAARPASSILVQLLFNGVIIMGMNYTIFLNCSVNSPLAHTVTGNIKAILTVVLGIVLFSVPIPWLGYVGLVIGIVGGGWFTAVKLKRLP